MARGGRRRRQPRTTAEVGGSKREESNRHGQQASPANYANQALRVTIAARIRRMIGNMISFLLSFCGCCFLVAKFFHDLKLQGDNVIRRLKQGAEICESRPYNYFCDLMPFIGDIIQNISAILDDDMFLILLYTIVGVYIYWKSVQHP